ncbi:MAG: MbnP family copper-binding protein [Myxococcota bacterium]
MGWTNKSVVLCVCVGMLSFTACGEDEDSGAGMKEFALTFQATADGQPVGCSDTIGGVGPDAQHSVGLSDLRFYVSNLQFLDADGNPLEVQLDTNEFQYSGEAGWVGMIDLTGTSEGTCTGNDIAFAEGTARTNNTITGMAPVGDVTSVSFDVGVPQPLMKEVIAATSPEAAPSPLNEMYWSWASGYRHFVLNLTVQTAGGDSGDGYLHIGSRDCGDGQALALADRETCGLVNTPKVALSNFDLEKDTVQVDVLQLLNNLSFVAPIYDTETFEVIGEGPGLECHSAATQLHCEALFSNFGLNLETGAATPASNAIFIK